ncbi:MAG: membrane-bound lytic murein transglycosylase MltF [Maricaulaceae bacterium]|jgi:membrane-bound lytic murein transglycosylase F
MLRSVFRWFSFAYRRVRALVLALALPAFLLTPSFGGVGSATLMGQVKERGVLRVASLQSPTTYYMGREGPAGPEYDLAVAYAATLGAEVEMVVADSIAGVLDAVDRGEADIAAAGLTIVEEQLVERRYAPGYMSVNEVVVCRVGGSGPSNLDDLGAVEIAVAEEASYARTLRALEAQGYAVSWREVPGASVDQLLGAVSAGEEACTIADHHQLDLAHRYYHGLDPALVLPDQREVAWVIGPGRAWTAASLESDVRAWFAEAPTRDFVARVNERYFGFEPEAIAGTHAAAFRRAMERSLPTYRELFETEAARVEMPWTLLAAVAYQESHWDPAARSPTGVRGMMMLTLPTARAMGVSNRIDAQQSTRGGALYLTQLRDRLPETIEGEDRWWFAAASYNAGWGHIMDARALTARLGKNPNLWSDVREVLPLLEDPAYYEDLRYGRGQGEQARDYVRRIRDFADMLEKRFDDAPQFAEAEAAEAQSSAGEGE